MEIGPVLQQTLSGIQKLCMDIHKNICIVWMYIHTHKQTNSVTSFAESLLKNT